MNSGFSRRERPTGALFFESGIGRPVRANSTTRARPGWCHKCGATLIRGPSASICENWWCDSLPKISAPLATTNAWGGV
jgi:hypothetical protein